MIDSLIAVNNISDFLNGSMASNVSGGDDDVVAGRTRPFWFLFCKIFLNIAGMIGNSTVIIIYTKKKDFRPSECFILSIAFIDFCFSFLSLLLWVLGFFSANTDTINSMLITFVIYYSLYLIFWVSFNRYIAVIKPIDYMQIFSSRTVFSIIATGFLFGVIFAMIPVLYYSTGSELYRKILDAIYYSSKVFFILVDIVFMCIVYSNVASLESRKAAKRHQKNFNSTVGAVEPHSHALGLRKNNNIINNNNNDETATANCSKNQILVPTSNGLNMAGTGGYGAAASTGMHAAGVPLGSGVCREHSVVLEESPSRFNVTQNRTGDEINVLPPGNSPTPKPPWSGRPVKEVQRKQPRKFLKLSRRANTEGNLKCCNAGSNGSTAHHASGIELNKKDSSFKVDTEAKFERQAKSRQLSVDMTVLESEASPRRKPKVTLLKKALTGIELHPDMAGGGQGGASSSAENSALNAPLTLMKPRTSLRQKRVTFTLFFVCSIFIAVTLPFTLVEILSYAPPIFNAKPIVVYELKLVTYLVYCINFVVNPFIYFFGNTFYRKELFELINNSFFCGKCKMLLPQSLSNA